MLDMLLRASFFLQLPNKINMETTQEPKTSDTVISTFTSDIGSGPAYPLTASGIRIESGVASDFRLAQKPDGSLVLQGLFQWTTHNAGGRDWRDIPTHVITESDVSPNT